MRDRISKLKRGAATALVVMGAAIMLPQTAFAQDDDRTWAGPNGAFSVTIPVGWQRIDAYVSGAFLLAIGPSPDVARRERRNLEVCSVEARPITGGPFSQGQINTFMDAMQAQLPAELGATVVHATSAEMQGEVRVVSIDVDMPDQRGAPTRQMQRLFALPTATGLMHYQIGCGASGGAYAAADYDAIRRFMTSLTVSGTDQ